MKNLATRVTTGLVCLVTPRCQHMTRLISESQEHELSPLTKRRMRWHYSICIWCERYRDQLGVLRKLSRRYPEISADHGAEKLSGDARERIKEALKSPPPPRE